MDKRLDSHATLRMTRLIKIGDSYATAYRKGTDADDRSFVILRWTV